MTVCSQKIFLVIKFYILPSVILCAQRKILTAPFFFIIFLIFFISDSADKQGMLPKTTKEK